MKNGEVRLDYMGSSIVMASLSSFSCKLEDHWLIPEHLSEQTSCEYSTVDSIIRTSVHVRVIFTKHEAGSS